MSPGAARPGAYNRGVARPPDAHDPAAGPGRPEETPVRAKSERTSGRSSRRHSGTPIERLRAVWRALPRERRLAGGAALGLVFTLFLPWYQETVIARGTTANLSTISASLTGWGAFSFVEAAVLLVAAAVIVLLFVRAEGAAFHVPGGDGGVITAAGLWVCLLIVWRMFDKQGTTGHALYDHRLRDRVGDLHRPGRGRAAHLLRVPDQTRQRARAAAARRGRPGRPGVSKPGRRGVSRPGRRTVGSRLGGGTAGSQSGRFTAGSHPRPRSRPGAAAAAAGSSLEPGRAGRAAPE